MFALSTFNPASSFFDDWTEAPSHRLTSVRSQTNLAVDVKETEKEYQVLVDVPGIPKENVSVDLEDGVLTVSVKAVEDEVKEGTKVHWRERRFREVKRSLRLPNELQTDQVTARQANGVLEITLPKKPEVDRVKKISVL